MSTLHRWMFCSAYEALKMLNSLQTFSNQELSHKNLDFQLQGKTKYCAFWQLWTCWNIWQPWMDSCHWHCPRGLVGSLTPLMGPGLPLFIPLTHITCLHLLTLVAWPFVDTAVYPIPPSVQHVFSSQTKGSSYALHYPPWAGSLGIEMKHTPSNEVQLICLRASFELPAYGNVQDLNALIKVFSYEISMLFPFLTDQKGMCIFVQTLVM